MRRNFGYALLIVAVLTIVAWLIGKYLLPVLPKSINSDLFLVVAILTTILGIAANFKDVIELITPESARESKISKTLPPENVPSTSNVVETTSIDPIAAIIVFSGEIPVHWSQDRIYEVFYERPFVRPPSLKLWQESTTSNYEVIEQRSDGFKVQGHELYGKIMWEARGDLA